MFKYKKYILKFRKSYQYKGLGTWSEVKDVYLMLILLTLQLEYDFEIISTEFRSFYEDSYIKIKCKKEDKNNIFGEYCLRLNKYIGNISF